MLKTWKHDKPPHKKQYILRNMTGWKEDEKGDEKMKRWWNDEKMMHDWI
jgi:hypothetical protein